MTDPSPLPQDTGVADKHHLIGGLGDGGIDQGAIEYPAALDGNDDPLELRSLALVDGHGVGVDDIRQVVLPEALLVPIEIADEHIPVQRPHHAQ